MELHKDKELFKTAILEVSKALKINEALIEKDYYVMHILRELGKNIPGLLFKGGTCCSHAYHAIDRFSEDIDLSLDPEHFGRKKNISANHSVLETCDRLGFHVANKEEIAKHSHGSLNCYYVEYPTIFSSSALKPFIQIEMAFYLKAYPYEVRPVNSLIGEWLVQSRSLEVVREYGLVPFDITVQKLERTFVDKVFALCDYYERKEADRNSRHIYDLYKIARIIDLSNPALKLLANGVREDRKRNGRCVSAAEGYDINLALNHIADSGYFKSDYEKVTTKLLTRSVDYATAISVLRLIIASRVFVFNS